MFNIYAKIFFTQQSEVKLIYIHIAQHIHHRGNNITANHNHFTSHHMRKTHFGTKEKAKSLPIHIFIITQVLASRKKQKAKFNFHKQRNHISFQTSVSERWECQEMKKFLSSIKLIPESENCVQWIFFCALHVFIGKGKVEKEVLLHLIILLFLLQVI